VEIDDKITATTLVALPRYPGPENSDPVRAAVELETTYPNIVIQPAEDLQELVRLLAVTMHTEEARITYRVPGHLPVRRSYAIEDMLEWLKAQRADENRVSTKDIVSFLVALPLKDRLALIARILQTPEFLSG
jgi:thioredoxin-like negative regulator of GroEL